MQTQRVLLVATLVVTFCLLIVDVLSAIMMYGFPKSEYGRSNYRLGLDTFSDIIVLVTVIWLSLQTLCTFAKGILNKRFKLFDTLALHTVPVISYVLVFLNFMALVANIFMFLNVNYLIWLSTDSNAHSTSIALKSLHSVELGLSVVSITLLVVLVFWPFTMLADCLIIVCSVLQVVITFATVIVNFSAVSLAAPLVNPVRQEKAVVCMSLFLGFTAFLGLATVLVVRSNNRLSKQSRLLVKYYMSLNVISAVLCLSWFIYSLCELSVLRQSIAKDVSIVNPVLAAIGFAVDICCIWCCISINSTPKTKLKVEEFDLSKLNSGELALLAKVVDSSASSKDSPDRPSGANALDLMMSYVNSPMENFSCRVLRVYDDSSDAQKYDQKKAWNQYDFENFFSEAKSEKTLLDPEPVATPLSKNAQKRLQKKNQKKNAKAESLTGPDELGEFKKQLANTEAVALLTRIHTYDLTSTVGGSFGAFLSRAIGKKSWLKLTCVRLGILGTHWPFRQMIFYTASTKKPAARQAAILGAITTWNQTLPASERCSILYNPMYQTPTNEATLKMSGWLITSLIPSHVIDLRPHLGKPLDSYLKSIKYRNRAVAFNKADGKVIDQANFTTENCHTAMSLWENIALKRVSDGGTPVLHEPTAEFLVSLGGQVNNAHSWRRLLFLKAGDDIIASCVLFHLGNTLTSDIQGLDHAKSRQYNAYFVMMQETIRIGLDKNVSFIDFGPTTGKAKTDIGCTEIPLLGGIYCRQPLATCVGLFANKVNG